MSNILQTAIEFYQKTLANDTKALDYLREIGITSNDAITAFELGFANGGITKACTPEQFKELQDAWLCDTQGRNHFQSTIVCPLYDSEGLRDIYGVNLGKVGAIKTLRPNAYGIGNFKAMQVYDEVLATDYLFEALKLFQAGFHNVLLVPDANAAKMVKAKKVTVLSYKQPETLAREMDAEEIWYGFINPKDSAPQEALRRIKCLKKPATIQCGNILEKVTTDLDELGYVAQGWQKKLIYLIATSRLMEQPLSGIVISSSGSGKSSLMNSVLELLPTEDRLLLSKLSPMSLYHAPEGFLEGKALVIDETVGSVGAEYTLRTAMSERKLSLQRPAKMKSDDTGTKTVKFRCAVLESSTHEREHNPENLSRQFVIRLDESPEATALILAAQRKAVSGDMQVNREEVLAWHHAFQKSLKSYRVQIPFATQLSFPIDRPSMRREQTKLLGLIAACALLHQNDRVIVGDVVQAGFEDYKIVYELYQNIFPEVNRELSQSACLWLEMLKQKNIIEFTLRDCLSISGWSYGKCHKVITELSQYCYIEANHTKKGRYQKIYRVLDVGRSKHQKYVLLSPDQLSA